MKIHVADYQEDVRVSVEHEYDPKALDLEFDDQKYKGPLKLTGYVERSQASIRFEGLVVSDIQHECGRCLKLVDEHLEKPFQFFYDVTSEDTIDATDDIREVIILNHPMNYICPDSVECKLPGSEKYLVKEEDEVKEKKKGYNPLSGLENLLKKKGV